MRNFFAEISFQTTRSGGKGGQNVNKVETAVIAFLPIEQSQLLSDAEKIIIAEKLANRINANGELWVKVQIHRTQLSNKKEAITKINELIHLALAKKKLRIAVKPGKAVKEKRLAAKKRNAEIKSSRKKYTARDE